MITTTAAIVWPSWHRGDCNGAATVAWRHGQLPGQLGDCAASRPTTMPSGQLHGERTVGQPRSNKDAAIVVTARPSQSQLCGHPGTATGPPWPLRGHGDRDSDCVSNRPLVSRAATMSGSEYDLNINQHRFSFTSCPRCYQPWRPRHLTLVLRVTRARRRSYQSGRGNTRWRTIVLHSLGATGSEALIMVKGYLCWCSGLRL